ncbi:hypothetical protein MHH52_01075 [Paenibacillus sp. FSL K6-0276]|uniref:hypothetical protein n=1 Tax=Paenibacillus sp. FSL K6-0276 TaxID=2921450 RepID=UPI0030EEB7DC
MKCKKEPATFTVESSFFVVVDLQYGAEPWLGKSTTHRRVKLSRLGRDSVKL